MAVQRLMFSGIHPDALVGADVRLSGVKALEGDIERVFDALNASSALQKDVSGAYTPTSPIGLDLVREPQNPHDPNAIRLDYQGTPLGYLPKQLSQRLAPMLDHDKAARFSVSLTQILPYKNWKTKQTSYSVQTRVELTTRPNRAPNLKERDKALDAFTSARTDGDGFTQILTVIPERIGTFEIDGKTITERFDHERNEKAFYTGGHLLARGQADLANQQANAQFLRSPGDTVKTEIIRRLNNWA